MNCAIQPPAIRFFQTLLFSFSSLLLFAQPTAEDTSNTLSTVVVKAYGQVRQLRDVPAAVSFVDRQTFNRFGSASVVMAVNTVPGVRMEERSPGSYRFNIRGSSLRSPFGVRNVKVYYNDIPFTDPGGHTYLNGLGYYNFGSLEILKGPGSSLYGAGTGGVLLVEGLAAAESPGVQGEISVGSFGLRNLYAGVTTGEENNRNRIGFQHQVSDGYRNHTALQRDVLSWTGQYRLSEQQSLKTTFLYSHHYYQTPGALTRAEFLRDPRLSRPAGGGFPSAEQARAAITQKTFVAGASFTQQFSSVFSNQSTAYGAFTELRNPTIRNYGKVTEPHTGGRTSFRYNRQFTGAVLDLSFGGEMQQGYATSTVFRNAGGKPDSLQTEDEIRVRQSFVFLQGNLVFGGWELTAGASLNGSSLNFRRAFPAPMPEQQRTLNNQLTPRFALARRFAAITLYTSVSKGFSPPTTAELLPTGSAVNLALQPEVGTNYDLGARGSLLPNLTFDINAFLFRLKSTIVQRRDAGGGEYFINVGRTAQKGIETGLRYGLLQNTAFFRAGTIWLNHTYHHFRYKDFKQLAADYSENALPGVAPHTLAAGADLFARNGLVANLTYYYSSRIPLNDANTEYANSYHLVGIKLGYDKLFSANKRISIFAGADNLLDQQFSLGNDVNAFGGRFFNAAAGRNYYVSLLLQLFTAQKNTSAPAK